MLALDMQSHCLLALPTSSTWSCTREQEHMKHAPEPQGALLSSSASPLMQGWEFHLVREDLLETHVCNLSQRCHHCLLPKAGSERG